MALSLKQSMALNRIAELMYSFLPGSGAASWKGHVSFATIARDVGVGQFWQGGSKEHAIASLLERTLQHRVQAFEPLILAIVRGGIAYRRRQGVPIKRPEIERLNALLLDVGFKFPDLHDSSFLASLSPDTAGVESAAAAVAPELSRSRSALAGLRTRFYDLARDENRQAAGIALQSVMTDLFSVFGLKARQPFRVVGEEIDGSCVMDNETYLIEAKWVAGGVGESDLLTFRGKIEGKSAFTRGIFISINGWSAGAEDAITRGKQPTFFLLRGDDLVAVLEDQIDLVELLRQKFRHLTEGRVFVSARELM